MKEVNRVSGIPVRIIDPYLYERAIFCEYHYVKRVSDTTLVTRFLFTISQ